MNSNILVSITLLCLTNHANSLSFEFTATETPLGLLNYGDNRFKVQSVCDSTRECRIHAQSRSQCNRWACCWVPSLNKCFAKKYFIRSQKVGESGQLETKFTIPKNGDGTDMVLTQDEAEIYCKNEYTNGRLARSDDLNDWRNSGSIKNFFKDDELKGDGTQKCYIGLTFKVSMGNYNIFTYDNTFLGWTVDTTGHNWGSHNVWVEKTIAILVNTGTYTLNTGPTSGKCFVCQHN